MIDRVSQFADDRQTGVLQQVVNVINRAGAGVFDRQDGVIRLAGFNLGEDILEFLATALDQLIEMASSILAGRQV
ncbi:hypothetical protein D3C86_1967030 [compost metagenome]